jgi:DNA-3-methyladenine glycosylase
MQSRLPEVRLRAVRPLAREFFARDPRRVARELLGKLLIRDEKRQRRMARIVETEAYLGVGDAAAHAAAGLTARNEVVFGPPGHAYVYFIYGNHYCLNVSCERAGKAGSVLIRALEPLAGLKAMARARGDATRAADLVWLTSGPGRLAQAFCITRMRDNGRDLTDPYSGLWLAEDGLAAPRVTITPRIGIVKAAERRLRYIVKGNAYVSGRRTPKVLRS